jgi:prepilin peptidase CpaA
MLVFLVCLTLNVIKVGWTSLHHPFCILVIGLVLFYYNLVGAGDVKLASSFSVAVKPEYQLIVALLIFILGGLVAIFQTISNRYKNKKRGVPYGVPISLGYLLGIAASL